MKKLISILLVFIMFFIMSIPVVASDSHLTYMNNPNYDKTENVNQGGSVTLEVGPAIGHSGMLHFTGFSTQAAAENVNWTVYTGSNLIASMSQSTDEVRSGVWVSTLTVNTANSGYGPISIRAANTNTGASEYAYYDFTIIVESSSSVGEVDNITIEVDDLTGDSYLYVYKESLTVSNAQNGDTFYNLSGAAQTYPTAANALDAILDPNGTGQPYVVPDFIKGLLPLYGHVYSITAFDWINCQDVYITPTYGSETLPWMHQELKDWETWYCTIIRDNQIVRSSLRMNAAAMQLESGDQIYWTYGTWDDVMYYVELISDSTLYVDFLQYANSIAVPATGNITETYVAQVTDVYWNVIEDADITYSLAEEYTGVSIDANTGVVTVTSEAGAGAGAGAGAIIIQASYNNECSKMTVNIEETEATTIYFTKDIYTANVPDSGVNTMSITALTTDVYGNVIENADITYSLADTYDGVSFDSSAGIVTVTPTALPGSVEIQAVCENISCTASLYFIDAGVTTTLSTIENCTYKISVNGNNMTSFENQSFIMTYDPQVLEIADLCAFTYEKETTTGVIPGTGITIDSFTPGTTVLSIDKPIDTGKQWSGVLNIFELTAIATTDTIIAISGI